MDPDLWIWIALGLMAIYYFTRYIIQLRKPEQFMESPSPFPKHHTVPHHPSEDEEWWS